MSGVDLSHLPPSPYKRPRRHDPAAALSLPNVEASTGSNFVELRYGGRGAEVGVCGQDGCPGRVWAVDDGDFVVRCCAACGFETSAHTSVVDPDVRARLMLEQAGLPDRFAGLVFAEDDDNKSALMALRGWLRDFADEQAKSKDASPGMPAPALFGKQGRGKSHLLTGLCTRLVCERKVSVLYRSVRELLRELQRFDDRVEVTRTWERAVEVDVLALDDLGAQQITDWRHDQLAHLIDERYSAERPIVLATNFPPRQWDQIVDKRTASRLAGMTFPVELKGRDRRQTQLEGAD